MKPYLMLVLVAFMACKKNVVETRRAATTAANAVTPVIPEVIDHDMYIGNHWILDKKVYITNGANLFIGEGTFIDVIPASNYQDAPAIIATRGSSLIAMASSSFPIRFQTWGSWMGIVLLGNAPLNTNDQQLAGIDPANVPPGVDIFYGGGGPGLGDPHNFAGALEYVYIEYAGINYSDDAPGAVTLAAVGDFTSLDRIEVYHSGGDAFKFIGGTVNAKHLFALAPNDDAFDFSRGYTGNIQFALSKLDPGVSSSANPNGIHSENDQFSTAAAPRTAPTISNMTVIGVTNIAQALGMGLLNSAHLRRNTSYTVKNSIFMGYPGGINIQSTGSLADVGRINYNVVHAFSSNAAIPATNKVYLGGNANDSMLLVDPFSSYAPDFRPVNFTSPAYLGTDFTDLTWDFFEWTSYRGAFDSSNAINWLSGWTQF